MSLNLFLKNYHYTRCINMSEAIAVIKYTENSNDTGVEEVTNGLLDMSKIKIKVRELASIKQLQGLVIDTVITTKSGVTMFTTRCCATLILKNGTVIKQKDLGVDEVTSLGLLSKEDLKVLKRAKKLGIQL